MRSKLAVIALALAASTTQAATMYAVTSAPSWSVGLRYDSSLTRAMGGNGRDEERGHGIYDPSDSSGYATWQGTAYYTWWKPGDERSYKAAQVAITDAHFDYGTGEFTAAGFSCTDVVTNGCSGIQLADLSATVGKIYSFYDEPDTSFRLHYGQNGDRYMRLHTDVPIPAAVWLFGSGLVGLFGLRKKGIRGTGR